MAEPAAPTVEATPPPPSPTPATGETFPEETPQAKAKEVGRKMVQVKVFLLDGTNVVIECEVRRRRGGSGVWPREGRVGR